MQRLEVSGAVRPIYGSLGVKRLTYIGATKLGSYPELDPWTIIHILGFIIPNFLPIFVMITAALAIFQAWIWVGVGIGKLLNDLGVTNILDTKLHGLGAC